MNDMTGSEENNSDIVPESCPGADAAYARVGYIPSPKRLVGFAAMDKDKVRKIASAGGKAAHERGTGHKFSKEEAKVAGSKGGKAPRKRKKVGQ